MKDVVKNILDHHYFGNGLYGLKEDKKILKNFTPNRVNDFIFWCFPKKNKNLTLDDANEIINMLNSLPEDVSKFILNYIFKIEYLSEKLSEKDFNSFVDITYKKYLKLADKYKAN